MSVNTYPTVGFNPDSAVSQLLINGSQIDADITNAISQAQLERVLVGASTLTLTIEDPARTIVNSQIAQIVAPTAPGAGLAPDAPYEPTTCALTDPATGDQLVFALCQVEKQGDQLTLVFEDFWINALRYAYATEAGYLTAAGTVTRADFIVQVIRKALPLVPIPVLVVPDTFAQIEPLEQATGDSQWGTTTNPYEDAWTCVTRLANAVQWRCFSNGNSLMVGPDAWLMSYPVAATFAENTGGVDSIDFTYDLGQAEATMTVYANTALVTFKPGSPIRVSNVGVASVDSRGNPTTWLASDISRSLFLPDTTIGAVQAQGFLTEDQLGSTVAATSNNSQSVPASPTDTPSDDASKAVSYALAQVGKPYVWGGTGPGAFDCSGLVWASYVYGAGMYFAFPRTSEDQWFNITDQITDMSQLLPGDLVFYNPGEDGIAGPGHVVMYVGNGNVVEAAHTGTVISVHPLDGGYIGARRPAP